MSTSMIQTREKKKKEYSGRVGLMEVPLMVALVLLLLLLLDAVVVLDGFVVEPPHHNSKIQTTATSLLTTTTTTKNDTPMFQKSMKNSMVLHASVSTTRTTTAAEEKENFIDKDENQRILTQQQHHQQQPQQQSHVENKNDNGESQQQRLLLQDERHDFFKNRFYDDLRGVLSRSSSGGSGSSSTGVISGPARAHAMLRHMAQRYAESKGNSFSSSAIKPDRTAVHIVMNGFLESHSYMMALDIEQILFQTFLPLYQKEEQHQQQDQYQNQNQDQFGDFTIVLATPTTDDGEDEDYDGPNLETYHMMLKAYAICTQAPRSHEKHHLDFAGRADRILQRLKDLYPSVVTAETYMWVIMALAKQQRNNDSDPALAERAASLLREMISMLKHKKEDTTATATSSATLTAAEEEQFLRDAYSDVMEAWAKCSAPQAPQEVEALLQECFDRNWKSCHMYTSAVLAHCKSRQRGSPERAQELLDEMLAYYEARENSKTSDKNDHNISKNDNHNDIEGKPPLLAINCLITSWGNAQQPKKAEDVLKRQLQWKESGNPLFAHLVPDVISYNAVIGAHAKSTERNSAVRAIQWLKEMDRCSRSSQNGNATDDSTNNNDSAPIIRPDAFSFTTAITACTRNDNIAYDLDSPERGEAIFRAMMKRTLEGDESNKPDILAGSSVLLAYARKVGILRRRNTYNDENQTPHSLAKKAHNFLNDLNKWYKEGKMVAKPNVASYCTVMDVYARCGDATNQALALLQEIKDRYRDGEQDMIPTQRIYTSAVFALSGANHPPKELAVQSYALLQELLELYEKTQDPVCRPNEYVYNYALKCCASVEGSLDDRQLILKLAARIFKEMSASDLVSPDSFTYAFFIKACSRLIPDGDMKDQLIKRSFQQCIKKGMLSDDVIKRAQLGGSIELLSELLGDVVWNEDVRIRDLPKEWSRNRNRFPQQRPAHNSRQ